MKKLSIVFVLVGCILFSSALAQQTTSTSTDTATINFVKKAAKGGLMEVATGKLATTKASSSRVRSFGLQMVKDHSKANTQLKQLAATKKIALPAAPPNDPMLVQTKGADFDRDYVRMMVKDHEEDVAMFQKAATSLPDPQIRAFAAQTLPILKEHLTMIKSIAADLHLSSGSE